MRAPARESKGAGEVIYALGKGDCAVARKQSHSSVAADPFHPLPRIRLEYLQVLPLQLLCSVSRSNMLQRGRAISRSPTYLLTDSLALEIENENPLFCLNT